MDFQLLIAHWSGRLPEGFVPLAVIRVMAAHSISLIHRNRTSNGIP